LTLDHITYIERIFVAILEKTLAEVRLQVAYLDSNRSVVQMIRDYNVYLRHAIELTKLFVGVFEFFLKFTNYLDLK